MDGFKNLIVWQKAMQLVRVVYEVVRAFPADERYALSDQLRRAAVSIPSNIAEGNGRTTNADYAHFLAMARGSLYETMTQMQIAQDLGYISGNEEFETLAVEVGSILGTLLKKYGALRSSPSPLAFTSKR